MERNNSIDISKVFETSDSAAALFRSADFLKSLDAYTETMANGNPNASELLRSADFLKSLDSSLSGGYTGYLKSVDLNADFLKSLDSLSKAPSPAASQDNTKTVFRSRDWVGAYEPGHVDVAYNPTLFKSGESSSLPKQSRSPKNRWVELYEQGLAGAVPAQAAAAPFQSKSKLWSSTQLSELAAVVPVATQLSEPADVVPVDVDTPMPPLSGSALDATSPSSEALVDTPMPPLSGTALDTTSPPSETATEKTANDNKATGNKKKRIYKSRKVVPVVKTFVQFTDDDVLLGRGGLSNKHPGNKRYRQEIENAKPVYRSAAKEEKTQWASLLVEYVQNNHGRFLEKDKATGQWYIVPDIVARRKAGQALREDNTAESRAEKRERYKKKLAMKT